MQYDIFFSISQTPVDGVLPSEQQMFRSFFRQVEAADQLGFGVAWLAESHLSSEVQKQHENPVIPHWQGEVGLNVNFLDLAARIFARTESIEVGSAIMNIVCMGGPVTAAERIASFVMQHGLEPDEARRLHVGFSGGRFEFMNRATGIVPRTPIEAAAWPALRGKIFAEAAEIFIRLLNGEVLSSDDVSPTVLTASDFRTPQDWERVQAVAGPVDHVEIDNRWAFDVLEIVPRTWRRELLQLVIGSHDPKLQERVNALAPVQVFNLSITRPDVIEDTHARLTAAYHERGGPWARGHMPRTTFVFLNEQPDLSPEQRSAAAREEATTALSAYWTALQGTIDPARIEQAADNALVGNAHDVAAQIRERFHPDDRLMLWFDFFNHDCDRVIANMDAFMNRVVPLLEQP
jgi:alkanesulfonate monooxygenase SsuD/methylene tetrahydromethanopterin reductase-like flavin-dependent oxidoreductase (luciferase family)